MNLRLDLDMKCNGSFMYPHPDDCMCEGTGWILTHDGRDLLEFLKRHRKRWEEPVNKS